MSRPGTFADALVAALLLFASAAATAQRPYIAIEQRFSSEQMRATGLDQLNSEQLTLLNQLLREEQANAGAESAPERDHQKREAETPISSKLKGEFHGWETGTVFELENGQYWLALDGRFYTTKRLVNPIVTVNPSLFGTWYMRVDGANVNIKVKRIEP